MLPRKASGRSRLCLLASSLFKCYLLQKKDVCRDGLNSTGFFPVGCKTLGSLHSGLNSVNSFK